MKIQKHTLGILQYIALMCNFRSEPYTVHQCAIVGNYLEDHDAVTDVSVLVDGLTKTLQKHSMKPKEIKVMTEILRRYCETDSWLLR